MYKVIVSDMDGTLLNSKEKITKNTSLALQGAMDKGLEVYIVSGRRSVDIKKFLDRYNLKCKIIGLNGAEITTDDGIYTCPAYIEKEDLIKIVALCVKENVICTLYTHNEVIVNELSTLSSKIYYYLKCYNSYKFARPTKDIVQYIDNYSYVCKLEIISPNRTKLNNIKNILQQNKNIHITSSYSMNLEITHTSINKGSTIDMLSKELDLPASSFIAFGDNLNDIEMIKKAGMGVAVENAVSEVKTVADFITKSNNDDGIAFALNKLLSV